MSNLTKRTLTAILFVVVLLGSILIGELTSSMLFLLIILLCQNEFYQFFSNSSTEPQKLIGMIAGGLLLCGSVVAKHSYSPLLSYSLFIPFIFLIFIIELYRKKEKPLNNISSTILGIVYIAIPFTLLHQLSYFENLEFGNTYSYEIIIGYFFLLWANDTGAYFAGRSFGKHKLFERISPKKTWEGSIGGASMGLLVGYLNSLIFESLAVEIWLAIALIVVVFGSLGDLVESLFKRSLNIKDSGNILPGHGGVLDRFDGIFISAPIVYTFLKLLSEW